MRSLFILLLCIVSLSSHAQDMIVTNDGDVIKAYNLEIGSKSIFYTLSRDNRDDIRKIDRSEVLAIKRQNGEKVLINEVGNFINSKVQSVRDFVGDIRYDIFRKRTPQYKIVRGDETLPNVDINNYHGFLLSEGNVVFVEAGPEDYDEVGANRLRQNILEDGFWQLAARREQAHFIIRYRVETKGADHIDTNYLNTREGLPHINMMQNNYDEYVDDYAISANESLSDNIEFADKLYSRILKIQKRIKKIKDPQKDSVYKYFYK